MGLQDREASERRIDRVRVQLAHRIVAIPWDSREQLFTQCAGKPALRHVIEAFSNLGSSRPVELLRVEKLNLLSVIEVRGARAGRLRRGTRGCLRPTRWAARRH